MRDAAVAGLKVLGETAAIAVLESYRGRVSDQDGSDVDRAIRALRAAAQPPKKAKDDDMEALREQFRKLDDAVGELQARVDAADEGAQ